jgi:hypothetical protein
VMYGAALQGLRFGAPIIYSGTFATGFFQCIYQPGPAHWAMLPTTLEWHLVMALVAVIGAVWPLAWIATGLMLTSSVAVAGLQAAQARLAPPHRGWMSRLVVFALCYAQPLVRAWHRYRTRLLSAHSTRTAGVLDGGHSAALPLSGRRTLLFWTNHGCDRTELLKEAIACLAKHRWGSMVGAGWSNWDLEIDGHSGTIVQVHTVQENHGGNQRLIRVQFRLRPRTFIFPLCTALTALSLASTAVSAWTAPVTVVWLGFLTITWWRATRLGGQIVALFQRVADELGLVQCPTQQQSVPARPAVCPAPD